MYADYIYISLPAAYREHPLALVNGDGSRF